MTNRKRPSPVIPFILAIILALFILLLMNIQWSYTDKPDLTFTEGSISMGDFSLEIPAPTGGAWYETLNHEGKPVLRYFKQDEQPVPAGWQPATVR